ncbi:MAG: hypothetical protein N2203_02535 [Bacteroidia bacterium]|nr:hypothetical protein [Bacteroidia bacterium]
MSNKICTFAPAMRKLLIILIPVFIIDLVFDGEQIIKLPSLVFHFYEHQQNHQLDFIDFLVLHYVNEHTQSDEHHNLPFKDHHNCSHIHFYHHKTQTIKIESSYFFEQEFAITNVPHIKSPSCFSVWHPPKV